nr:hypothetical protein [Ruminococcus flavefaciens]
MNKDWSDINKEIQTLLKKKDTYNSGLAALFKLRDQLMETVLLFRDELDREDFNAIPFINAEGYHSKTIAYSLWHIFRIEDIVTHTLINGDDQIFFYGNYKERINTPIITTGNELVGQDIADFSAKLNIDELYTYISEVKNSTESVLSKLPFDMLKKKISPERKDLLISLNTVSTDENAAWLVDYWCSKDIRGLIQMPFSRHWIMHIEASLRIMKKLKKRTKTA